MELTRGEMQDLLAKFATESDSYRERLLADPKEVIQRQFGVDVPGAVSVKVLTESADTVYVVLPHIVEQGDELSDADLEAVAGGHSIIKEANCQDSDGALNTVNNFEMSLV